MGVADLLTLVVDVQSWRPWNFSLIDTQSPSAHYRDAYDRAAQRTGLSESVVAGEGTIRGRRVAIIAGEPSFLGGSIGLAAGELLTQAIERATDERLPLIAFPVGGGTRMQEGTLAFLQMTKITGAVMAHKAANLPYLVYLRNPTMGGVFASWGSLGHVHLAEPEALVGFLGPRVYEALYRQPFPEGVQVSENLHERGIIDAVVPPEELAEVLDRILTVLMARREQKFLSDYPDLRPAPSPQAAIPELDAWDAVLDTRRLDRPGLRELLDYAATDVTMLNGTGDGDKHPGSVLAFARFQGAPCVVLGQCRSTQTVDNPLDPAALREARRGIRLARELRLPLVTVIDTPGAALSKEAEERGLGGEIARTLGDLMSLPTPTVSVLLGQGTGGIALALMPADRVIAAHDAWLAPLPPEGASAIVHRDTEHAADLARAQGIRATDLLANKIVDRVVVAPAPPHLDPAGFCTAVGTALGEELITVMMQVRADRRAARRWKYRHLGL